MPSSECPICGRPIDEELLKTRKALHPETTGNVFWTFWWCNEGESLLRSLVPSLKPMTLYIVRRMAAAFRAGWEAREKAKPKLPPIHDPSDQGEDDDA